MGDKGARRRLAADAMAEVEYRNAGEADAAVLAALFADTFTETFGHLYDPGDLDAFLGEQSAGHWAAQLRDDAFAVRMAVEGGEAVALAKIGPVKLPVDEAGPALELRQLYVRSAVRGSGVAARLMDWAIAEASGRGARNLYLSVYMDNPRARRFYARYGFVEIGPVAFMVGSQADEDIILRRELP